jgi:hypothetical protein
MSPIETGPVSSSQENLASPPSQREALAWESLQLEKDSPSVETAQTVAQPLLAKPLDATQPVLGVEVVAEVTEPTTPLSGEALKNVGGEQPLQEVIDTLTNVKNPSDAQLTALAQRLNRHE